MVMSGTGVSSGEREAGLTVGLADDIMRSLTRLECSGVGLSSSWEPKSCWDKVMGLSRRESRGEDERVTTPESRRKRLSSSTSIRLAFCALRSKVSSSLFRISRASTSSRLRSREDWAARRLRRTRSTRRCSFSSSVFARFLETFSRYEQMRRGTKHTLEEGWSWARAILGPMISASWTTSSQTWDLTSPTDPRDRPREPKITAGRRPWARASSCPWDSSWRSRETKDWEVARGLRWEALI